MKTVSVNAHFDAKHLQLDEPLDLVPNTKFIVTVLSEHKKWLQFSSQGLARAYTDDKESYDLNDIKVPNPAYARG